MHSDDDAHDSDGTHCDWTPAVDTCDGAAQTPPDIAAIFRGILSGAYMHACQLTADLDRFGEDDIELFYDALVLRRDERRSDRPRVAFHAGALVEVAGARGLDGHAVGAGLQALFVESGYSVGCESYADVYGAARGCAVYPWLRHEEWTVMTPADACE
jgi:hypothetical protein